MLRAVLLSIGLLLVPSLSRASPTTIDAKELAAIFEKLVEQLDEPAGLAVLSNQPMLGLMKGDLIRSINGHAAVKGPFGHLPPDAAILYLDLLRAGKEVTLRVVIRSGAVEAAVRRDRLRSTIAMLDAGLLAQLTRSGAPSGVMIRREVHLGVAIQDGDVVRKIDGASVKTVAEALAALRAAVDRPKLVLSLERLGQPFEITLEVEDEPKIDPEAQAWVGQVHKVDDTTYEIPRAMLGVDGDTWSAVTLGGRIVPSIKDGKANGFKLYAIRPASILAAVGLQNGDTVTALNGMELTSMDAALTAVGKVQAAVRIEVDLVRRGQPVKLVWMLR